MPVMPVLLATITTAVTASKVSAITATTIQLQKVFSQVSPILDVKFMLPPPMRVKAGV